MIVRDWPEFSFYGAAFNWPISFGLPVPILMSGFAWIKRGEFFCRFVLPCSISSIDRAALNFVNAALKISPCMP